MDNKKQIAINTHLLLPITLFVIFMTISISCIHEKEIGMTVEGYSCARCAYELSRKAGVEMPIIEQVYKVLYEDKSMFQYQALN